MLRPNESRQFPTIIFIALFLLLPVSASAQTQTAEARETHGLPRQIQYKGQLAATGLQSVTFALYSSQDDPSPEWLETQNVALDSEGGFTVDLGASSPDGLPQYLFTDNSARWLGVRLNQDDAEESARILLISVPYAMKAGDAETLGGLSASSFVMTPEALPSV